LDQEKRKKELEIKKKFEPLPKLEVPAREVALVNEGGDLVLEYLDKDQNSVKEEQKSYYNGLPSAEDD